MFRMSSLAAAFLLFGSGAIPWVYPLEPKPASPASIDFSTFSSPPDIFLTIVQQSTQKSSELQPASRLALVRYVDGEYAKVVLPIPSAKHGFRYNPGQPLDQKQLHQALMRGSAANPGDHIQITDVEFRAKEIAISINGGTKSHFNLRQHLQISMGPIPTAQPVSNQPNGQARGAVLVLYFGRPVPDLSPDELKHDLSPFLDFSGEHSSAVNWVDTLPPKFQQAIKEHKAVEGMNHDMVMAAMGQPDQKFRERDENGKETEDWIYGFPPSKTTQVTFSGDSVIRVQVYN